MARPRKHNISIPNLYRKLDKRNGKVYWQYYNQLENQFVSMGVDETIAKAAAVELNRIIAERQVENAFTLVDSILRKDNPDSKKIRLHSWVDKYCDFLDKRQERKELAYGTVRQRKASAIVLKSKISNMHLADMGAREMAAILEEYKDQDKYRMANQLRHHWADLFKEAQYAGEVPPGFNPALATRKISFTTRRGRLELEDWRRIFEASKGWSHFASCSLLLALVTGQRLGDIIKMKFTDIWDDYLHIEQEKTGNKIALPLSLYCEPIAMSLKQVIDYCRDQTLTPFLVHHTRTLRRARTGGQVSKTSLSKMFCDIRNELGIESDGGKTPPTFHEQRSLSERLYEKQGINTQLLLGHATAAMTAAYHDDRKNDWVKLAV